MYAKIFTQIFYSSIADDYELRHFFEDLLKLADPDGNVDMTMNAISAVTRCPGDRVPEWIGKLMSPDTGSRSPELDGRRLVLMDERRAWGWRIVNYKHYRAIQDEESRRAYNRAAQQRHREKLVSIRRNGRPLPGEKRFVKAGDSGAGEAELSRMTEQSVAESLECRKEQREQREQSERPEEAGR